MDQYPDFNLLETIMPLLQHSADDSRPVVLMTCGIAGSGKSTLAKAVITELPHFARLSIDEIIFEQHGLYGTDYPADSILYQQYQDEAQRMFLDQFHGLLSNGRDMVLDRSFYAKEDRDEFKKMIGVGGGRGVLVYLKAGDKEALWKRICDRAKKEKDANSAFDISRDVYEMYWRGFEGPADEGEVVVKVCDQAQVRVSEHGIFRCVSRSLW